MKANGRAERRIGEAYCNRICSIFQSKCRNRSSMNSVNHENNALVWQKNLSHLYITHYDNAMGLSTLRYQVRAISLVFCYPLV